MRTSPTLVERDQITAINFPEFSSVQEAISFFEDDDMVLRVHYKGISKAYHSNILDRHEIVNDLVGNNPLSITYCPLTGSGIGYSALEFSKAPIDEFRASHQ